MIALTETMSERDVAAASMSRPRHAPLRNVVIATLNRPAGDTGVHSHTRALQQGLGVSRIACRVCGPFFENKSWLPVFAMRRLIHPVSPRASLRWYRHWHRAALRENLRRQLRREPADIVLCQCPVSADAALEVRDRLKSNFAIVLVCHFNRSEADEYRTKGELGNERAYQRMLEFERRLLLAVDHVIFVSRWARQIVEQERGILPRHSSVIWNGIEPEPTERALTRQSLGLASNDLVLLNVGSLEARKNQLALLELFADLSRQFPQARLLLAGDGPDRPKLLQRMAALSLTDRAKLLGHRTDVADLLRLADIYIHYAQLENCPIALLEAARAGRAIAAVPSGGVAELLEQLGGVALDGASRERSSAEIAPLLQDPSLRQELGRRARNGFLHDFTLGAMCNRYIEALSTAIAVRSNR